jgi:hypothetical protein
VISLQENKDLPARLDQTPSLKARFINRFTVDDIDDEDKIDTVTSYNFDKASLSYVPPRKRNLNVSGATKSECLSPKASNKDKGHTSSPAKSLYPVSLSVTEMIKLGKFNKATSSTTVVNIFKNDIESFTWSKIPTVVEFSEEKEPFAQGGFRKAFKVAPYSCLSMGLVTK